MKIILFSIISLFSCVLQISAQDMNKDTILSTIQILQEHPFDTSKIKNNNKIVHYVEKMILLRQGDMQLVETLKANINTSLVCIFIKYYILGKALWAYSNNDFSGNDLAKMKGMRSMNEIYRKIKKKNPDFDISIMNAFIKIEASNDLRNYIKKYMQDRLYDGEPFPGLVKEMQGISSNPDYGYKPNNPIKIGGDGSQIEIEFLKRLRSPNGDSISYKLVRIACCNAYFYNKITGKYALLDVYKVKISGYDQPVYLYFDTYHSDAVYCPTGLSHIIY